MTRRILLTLVFLDGDHFRDGGLQNTNISKSNDQLEEKAHEHFLMQEYA